MSLLIVRCAELAGLAPAQAEHLVLAEAARQGFSAGHKLAWPTGFAWWFDTPVNPRGSGALHREGDRYAASVGALQWRGRRGADALKALLACGDTPQQLPLSEISGSFVLLIGGPTGVWLCNDTLGLHKVYEVGGGAWRSTSMMVCRALLPRPKIDRLRAQEYVLLGANHARQTPLQGLSLMDPKQAINLATGASLPLHRDANLRQHAGPKTAAEAVEAVADNLAQEFRQLAQAWGPGIGMALSGGFDSRLLLAALDHVGVPPRLYVYGRAADADVVIGRQIAARLGRDIEVLDKSLLGQDLPPLTAAALRANYAFFDGLPVDGVFDRGIDQRTRLMQVQGGLLNLNGGGGEILRNFFYLPDRNYSARDVVNAFYSGWLDEVFVSTQEREAFMHAMQTSVLDALGQPSGSAAAGHRPLPRSEIELVYSQFRLRYWMGRNNSVAARYGAFMTPLVTPSLVALLAPLPMRWKDCGALEAKVITRLSARVAQGPSAYGFDFSQGPGWRQRLAMAGTLVRPPWLRHHSLRVQRQLGRVRTVTVPSEWQQAAPTLGDVDWLNPAWLTQREQLNRLFTLQGLLDDSVCGVVTRSAA